MVTIISNFPLNGHSTSVEQIIPIPYQTNILIYNEEVQAPIWNTSTSSLIKYGQINGIEPGIYNIIFQLQEGYGWDDPSLNNESFFSTTWEIKER